MEPPPPGGAGVHDPAAVLLLHERPVGVPADEQPPAVARSVLPAVDEDERVAGELQAPHRGQGAELGRAVGVAADGDDGGDGTEPVQHAAPDVAGVEEELAPGERLEERFVGKAVGVGDEPHAHRPQCTAEAVRLRYTGAMPTRDGRMKAREFLFYCEDQAMARLPAGFPQPERRVMWTILQLHYGEPNVHFELQPQVSRGIVELGLHFEGPVEANEAAALVLAERIADVLPALGEGWELEEWTASWRRLHRTFPFERLDGALAREVAEAFARLLVTIEPLMDELLRAARAAGAAAAASAAGGRRFRHRRPRARARR